MPILSEETFLKVGSYLRKISKAKCGHMYGGPQRTAANKCILVQRNICGCKQIYIDAKRIKHEKLIKFWCKLTKIPKNKSKYYDKLINAAANK